MRCSIFCATGKCRQPGGRSATRGMRGKAMTRAVFKTEAELTLSLERRTCHRLGYVAGAWHREQEKNSARAPRTPAFAQISRDPRCAARFSPYRSRGD
jgi:hypothetical protein